MGEILCLFGLIIELLRRSSFWQVNGEGAALAKLGSDGHFPAVQEGQVFDYGETETGAAHVSRTRPVNAIKALEESFEMLCGNTVAVVLDQNLVACS